MNRRIFKKALSRNYETPTNSACRVTTFFLLPLNATISFIDFTVKSYDFIDDLYHSAKPVWQNKVKKNTASYRGFIPFIDSYHSVNPMWQNKLKKNTK